MNNAVLKKAIINVIRLVGVTALSSTLQAASFDCAKAATPIEKMICESPAVSNLDEQLATAYKSALEKATDKDALKQQQRTWLKEKRNTCKDATCLFTAYQQRLGELLTLSAGVGESLQNSSGVTKVNKFITFTLLEGDGYPLCKEYVDMLNKAQYTEIPACSRKILPEFKNFQEIAWVEITDKEEMIKITKERMAIQQALNPTHSKQMYDPVNRIKPINENRLRMYAYKMQINNDSVMDIVYRNHVQPKNYKNKYGHCPTVNNFYINDSKVTAESIRQSTRDPYSVFNVRGSNELFIYGGNLYVSIYSGKAYYKVNFEIYGVGNKKMCGILAK